MNLTSPSYKPPEIPSIRSPNPHTSRTIRDISLPRNFRIRRQVAVGREARRQVIAHVGGGVGGADALQRRQDVCRYVVQEDEIDRRRNAFVGGEGGVGLHVLRLRIVGDLRVRGVVSRSDAEIVGGDVAGSEYGGLPASYAVVGAGFESFVRCDGADCWVNAIVSREEDKVVVT